MMTEKKGFAPWLYFPSLRNPLVAGLIAFGTFLFEHTKNMENEAIVFGYLMAILLGGYIWAIEGIKKVLFEREIGIPILMMGATAGALYLQMYDEAAALVVLFGIAEGIEEYTYDKTRNAIKSLLDLAPKKARVIRHNKEQIILATELKKGDIFIVLPGEAVPTDGVILEGETTIDESLVTGESIPVDKKTGDRVFPATINGQGTITVKAISTFENNTLSRIIDLVQNAQEQKGRAQAWIERFGRIYSPAVLSIGGIMISLPFFIDANTTYWIEKAVILLVTAAPCALVISLPITMASGISGAARRGILIKGGAHLEHLGTVKMIAFDKTGTLTYGKPNVTDTVALIGSKKEMIAYAAALERYSSHPLAKAILEYAKAENIDIPVANDTKAIFGSGVKGIIDNDLWYLGSPEYFQSSGYDLSSCDMTIKKLRLEGKTVVLIANSVNIAGIIGIQDSVRENAAMVIKRLNEMGIRTIMLTGDNLQTALRIARQIGIDDVRAELKPEEKVAAVLDLMKEGPTLMVGDGVNDAPALATATCGIAMGAAGSDAAIEAADIALMADDLYKIVEAVEIGRKALQVSKQNILFSIIVLTVLIPAGVGGYINIAIAVLAHEASELLAVANGLRARNHT